MGFIFGKFLVLIGGSFFKKKKKTFKRWAFKSYNIRPLIIIVGCFCLQNICGSSVSQCFIVIIIIISLNFEVGSLQLGGPRRLPRGPTRKADHVPERRD